MSIFGFYLNSEPVLEKYVGSQRKEFKQIEAELKKIIAIVKEKYAPIEDRIASGNTTGVTLKDSDLNHLDATRTIEKLFKKVFGLRDFSLDWTVSATNNAMTFIKSFLFVDSNYRTDKTGHQTNNKLFICMTVMTGLITYADLNEKELLAVMLHEIGHNFYNSIFNTLATISISIPYLNAILDAINGHELIFKGQKAIKEYVWNQFPKSMKLFTNLGDAISYLSRLTANPISKVMNGALFIMQAIKNPLAPIFRYSTEKHADSFAVDYGYGVYLAKGLDKMSKSNEKYAGQYYENKFSWMFDFLDVQAELLLSIGSGYPTTQNRIRSGLDRLEMSAKDPNLDPRVREELKKQIKAYSDFYYNEYMKIEKDPKQTRAFSAFFTAMVEDKFNGKFDLREYLDRLDPKRRV